MLKARLEPIETAHREYKNYPSSAIVKRDAYDKAISKCMELKDLIELVEEGVNKI
jgi:hypothetical protein